MLSKITVVLMIILNGIFLGVLLSFLIGPVFFVLIETSLRKGPIYAIFIDIGVFLSDVLYLLIAYYFSKEVVLWLNEYDWVRFVAAAIFIGMGLASILKKSSPAKRKEIDIDEVLNEKQDFVDPDCVTEYCEVERFKKRTAIGLILKGMGLNAINPGVLIYWIMACTAAQEELNVSSAMLPYYFSATLITFFSLDMLKIYFAGKLKEKMTNKMMKNISVVIGCIFIAAGLLLTFKHF